VNHSSIRDNMRTALWDLENPGYRIVLGGAMGVGIVPVLP
jgi:hypothetical protein